MEDKLKKLTEQLYQEGLERGEVRANEIIKNAKQQAEKIIIEAQKQAEEFLRKGEETLADKKKRVESEIALAAKQIISKTKSDLTNLITLKVMERPLADAFNESDFIKNLILDFVADWDKRLGAEGSGKLEIAEKYKRPLENFIRDKFHKKVKDREGGGIESSFCDDLSSGFRIIDEDFGFKIEFSEESFRNFLSEHLKPLTKELLFKQ